MPRARSVLLAPVLALACTGCGLFGDDATVSVLDVEPGQCFVAPTEVRAELTELATVDCDQEHDQEAYAVVDFTTEDERPATHPGEDALVRFADGTCAEQFRDYVGVDYLDSSLYFTYLLPSVRGWDESDHAVVCFITAAGERLTESVAGSHR